MGQKAEDVLREFRVEQIVQAAREVFGREGIEAASMNQIASQAGLARSTVYAYFPNKGELLRACLEIGHEWIRDELREAVAAAGTAREALIAFVATQLERVDQERDYYRAINTIHAVGSWTGTSAEAEMRAMGKDFRSVLEGIVARGVESGEFRPLDCDAVASWLGAWFFGAAAIRAAQDQPAAAADEAARNVALIMEGLGARARESIA
jgi:AcrR family transcriptional regulator